MEPKISQVRIWIKQTEENLERLARICDTCVPVAKDELVNTLDKQNLANLKSIFYSLKSLSKRGKSLEAVEDLEAEVNLLRKDYNFMKVQYQI